MSPLNFTNRGSWIWKRIMKLRNLARSFIFCDIGDGQSCSFWNDNWTNLGPLINITGPDGPRFSGISVSATVSNARVNGLWRISSRRSPIISLLRACLPPASTICRHPHNDRYYWCTDRANPVFTSATAAFNAMQTWEAINPPPPVVPWHSLIWFPKHIPKHAFISWVAIRNRLATRDRLRSWGMDVSPLCMLCNSANETRNHLFFDCAFSRELWHLAFGNTVIHPSSLDQSLQVLSTPRLSTQMLLIRKLLHQGILYQIWCERNKRLFRSEFRSVNAIYKDICNIMRSKLLHLSPPQINGSMGDTYLSTWFGYVDFLSSTTSPTQTTFATVPS